MVNENDSPLERLHKNIQNAPPEAYLDTSLEDQRQAENLRFAQALALREEERKRAERLNH